MCDSGREENLTALLKVQTTVAAVANRHGHAALAAGFKAPT